MTDLIGGRYTIVCVVQVPAKPDESPEQAAAWLTRSLMLTAEAYGRGAKMDVTVIDQAAATIGTPVLHRA